MSKKNNAADVTERASRFAPSPPTPHRDPARRPCRQSGKATPSARPEVERGAGIPDGDIALAGLAALDQLSIGIAIVDRRSRVIWANRYCDEILADADGLSIIGGELRASNHRQSSELLQGIREIGDDGGGGETTTGVMTLTRPSGRRSYHAAVRSLCRAGLAVEHHVAVFVTDPQRDDGLDAGHIASLFDLTHSESELAARLAAGKRLDLAAAELGVATGTARTHLKHIFQKTGTGRQGELSRLLRALLGKLRWNRPKTGSAS